MKNNTLTLIPREKIRVGNRAYFWVTLETSTETRECCYTRHCGEWQHEDGDCEPSMSEELRKLFHGSTGERALRKCYRTNDCTQITA